MRDKILLFILGFGLGIVAVLSLRLTHRQTLYPAAVTLPTDHEQIVELKRRLANSEMRVNDLEAYNAKLSADVTELESHSARSAPIEPVASHQSSPPQSPWAAMFGGGEGTNQFGEAMGKVMKVAMKQQVDTKVSALKVRLQLTDGQELKIRELYDQQFGKAGEVATKMFHGNASKEELTKMGNYKTDQNAQIKEVLTPEQQAEYEKYLVEERQTQAQMMANMEIMQMQSMLQLTPEQQDQVYNVLYQQAEQQMGGKEGAAQAPMDWEKQFESKKEALRPVLTPEQFQQYEKYIESQREMIRALVPSIENMGATSTPPATVITIHAP